MDVFQGSCILPVVSTPLPTYEGYVACAFKPRLDFGFQTSKRAKGRGKPFRATKSMSGQEGIDKLLAAESEATEIVAKARKGQSSAVPCI